MIDLAAQPCTAFEGHRTLVAAPLSEVALAVRRRTETGTANPILVFDDSTGQVVDLDLRGSDAEILERLARRSQDPGGREHQPTGAPSDADGSGNRAPRGRGRPRLGVVAREVTLLPRHWDWLAAQPGGASAALRRLVDTARQRRLPMCASAPPKRPPTGSCTRSPATSPATRKRCGPSLQTTAARWRSACPAGLKTSRPTLCVWPAPMVPPAEARSDALVVALANSRRTIARPDPSAAGPAGRLLLRRAGIDPGRTNHRPPTCIVRVQSPRSSSTSLHEYRSIGVASPRCGRRLANRSRTIRAGRTAVGDAPSVK